MATRFGINVSSSGLWTSILDDIKHNNWCNRDTSNEWQTADGTSKGWSGATRRGGWDGWQRGWESEDISDVKKHTAYTGWSNIASINLRLCWMTINKWNMRAHVCPESLCFDLQPFKIDTCCKFLWPCRKRIYENLSILDVSVFHTQVDKGRYSSVAIVRGLLNYAKKVITT
jgi:hypothetical protein